MEWRSLFWNFPFRMFSYKAKVGLLLKEISVVSFSKLFFSNYTWDQTWTCSNLCSNLIEFIFSKGKGNSCETLWKLKQKLILKASKTLPKSFQSFETILLQNCNKFFFFFDTSSSQVKLCFLISLKQTSR